MKVHPRRLAQPPAISLLLSRAGLVLDALKPHSPKLAARPRQRLTSYDFIESAR
jgi:hypothetical protein